MNILGNLRTKITNISKKIVAMRSGEYDFMSLMTELGQVIFGITMVADSEVSAQAIANFIVKLVAYESFEAKNVKSFLPPKLLLLI